MKRKQFTFYRSFYEALECLPKAQQLEFLKAVIAYALDGEEPQLRTKMQKGQFTLIRPVLKRARLKAIGGAKAMESYHGHLRTNGSKIVGNKGEKEIEEETEIEIETEIEAEIETETEALGGFEKFWDLYPRKIGIDAARKAWTECVRDPEAVLESLRQWCQCLAWGREGGRFVPFPEKWLRQGYFNQVPEGVVPRGATGHLGEAELEAIRKLLEEE